MNLHVANQIRYYIDHKGYSPAEAVRHALTPDERAADPVLLAAFTQIEIAELAIAAMVAKAELEGE